MEYHSFLLPLTRESTRVDLLESSVRAGTAQSVLQWFRITQTQQMDPRSASRAREAAAARHAKEMEAGHGGGGDKGSSNRARDLKETKAERASRREAASAAAAEEQEAKQGEAEDQSDAAPDAEVEAEGGDEDEAASENDAEQVEDEADDAAAQLAVLQELLAQSERRRAEAEAREAEERALAAKAVEALAKAVGSTVSKQRRAAAEQDVDGAMQKRLGAEGCSDDEETALLKVAEEKAAELRALEQSIRAARAAKDVRKRQAATAPTAAGAGAGAPGSVAVAQQSLLGSPLASPPHARLSGASAAFRALGANAAPAASGWCKPPTPKELTATEATKPEALEDWIYATERMLRAVQASTFAEQMEYAGRYWDRAVQAWWTGAQLLARERGQPVANWEAFVATLRANYSPVADADTAMRKLVSVRMGSAETMEAYVARAQELVNRIPQVRLESHTAAEFLLAGVDSTHFPITYAALSEATQAARKVTGGRGLGFAEARAKLVEAAAREPLLFVKGGSTHHRGHAGSGTRTQVNAVATSAGRYDALAREDENDDREESGQEQRGVNAINRDDATCYRCHLKGHLASECKKPDPRKCFNCGKTGHFKSDCRAPLKGKGSAAGGTNGVAGGAPGGAGAGQLQVNSSKNG
jgi:hypothetical protein